MDSWRITVLRTEHLTPSHSPQSNETTPDLGSGKRMARLYAVFFISGFPALIYQIVWQRSLFTIYGVDSESIAVVVTAFLLGLGIGSLLGGTLSRTRFPLLLAFGLIETGIGLFGIFSLKLLGLVGSQTLGASATETFFYSFLLMLLPTILMGATLPILVEYLVRRVGNVGRSVGILYGVNTLGSATACFVAAIWLLGGFGMTGTVYVAAIMNFAVGAGSLLLFVKEKRRSTPGGEERPAHASPESRASVVVMPFGLALGVASVMGFLSLSYEILWVRVYSFISGGQAHSFPFLLGSFLTGIALGALVVRPFCDNVTDLGDPRHSKLLAYVVFFANLIGFSILPVIALSAALVPNDSAVLFPQWYMTLPAVVIAAAVLGATLPLISHIAIDPAKGSSGAKLSYLYAANIIGSSAGGLVTGFYLLDWFSVGVISTGLALLGLVLTAALFLRPGLRRSEPARPLAAVAAAAFVVVLVAPAVFDSFYERLLFKEDYSTGQRFANIIETKTGVITVGEDRVVYGHGTYDGTLNTSLIDDTNGIFRAYGVSAFHPVPRNVLMIGLSSGSWANVLAHHPQVESLTVVEINRGYLDLVAQYPAVSSILVNPKIEIVIDDGRRWLRRNDDQFDLVVMNTTYHWRSNSTNLLSAEFLELVRDHLKPDGVLMFNATESSQVQRTAALVFPYAYRFSNFMVVSDSPIVPDGQRLRETLATYVVDGRAVFDMNVDQHRQRLEEVVSVLGRADGSWYSTEGRESILARTIDDYVVTDDNMGTEWRHMRRGIVSNAWLTPLAEALFGLRVNSLPARGSSP